MSIDIELFGPLFVLITFLIVAVTVLIRGPRIFRIQEWPKLARIGLIALLSIQFLWVLCVSLRLIPNEVNHRATPWMMSLLPIAYWPGIIQVWRKRLPTDMPLFHVPPVGTPAPGQQRRVEEKP